MKIDYISSDGIQHAEKVALERIRQAFNQSTFSQKWHGYAGFMMVDRVHRDREIDLILLTHDRLLMIELKNWRGRITPMQDHWLLNNNDMGRSPVKVTADKCKILASKMKRALPEPARSVWNEYRVVICGEEDIRALSEDERRFIVTLDEFVKIATEGNYTKVFGPRKSIKACEYTQAFTAFFRGPEFKPTAFSFNNFQIDGDVLFPHPDGLYKEYRAVKKDDARLQALLRRWDFVSLAGKVDTTDERATVALREHKALAYIQENNEELYANLFQPLTFPTRDDIDVDFCELYRLPVRQARLSEFVARYRDDLTPADRLALVKVLLSHFASLHDLGVAHRDIGDHSVWLERPAKISISGLITAYFPEAGTVGGLRDVLRAGGIALPEDTAVLGTGTESNAFRRDVYLLSVASHLLLFLTPPKTDGGVGIHVWQTVQNDPYDGVLNNWMERGLDPVPSDRFASARDMLNALNSIETSASTKTGLDMRVFEPYKTHIIPLVAYPIELNLKQSHAHVYQSSVGGEKVTVKVWYGIAPDPKKIEDSYRLFEFLERLRIIKVQGCTTLPNIIDFGISQAGLFVVTQWVEGICLSDELRTARPMRAALELCQALLSATAHLHALNLFHGDLSPDNIVVNDLVVRFIDIADFFSAGPQEPRTLAYSPADADVIPAEERDCFAVAKICTELLSSAKADPQFDLREVGAELDRSLARELNVYRLDRTLDAISRVLAPPKSKGPSFTLMSRNLREGCSIVSDNGLYHLDLFADRKSSGNLMLLIAGVRKQLLIAVDKTTKEPSWLSVRDVQHSQFVGIANRAIATLEATIDVVPARFDRAADVVVSVLQIPSVFESWNDLVGVTDEGQKSAGVVSAEPASVPRTDEIWKAIIEAEEATLPEIEVAGESRLDSDRFSSLIVPYSKIGEPLDYESDDKIEVLQELNGELVKVGRLNTRETSPSILVIDDPNLRVRRQIGDRLKLRSIQDRASFQRRRSAASRIISRESVIPNLIDYFDPANVLEPTVFSDAPTDEALNVYTVTEGDRIIFELNPQQRDAFRRLWRLGPVGLLQGPPGTGKTAFIASFIHHAITTGAQTILLASQSHEAVNNAAEKVLELCTRTGLNLGLVRFGQEGMVSETLRPYHSSSILHQYRELFRSEMRLRISSLSKNLGLPHEFVEQMCDIEAQLGRMSREISDLQNKLSNLPVGRKDHSELDAKIQRRLAVFQRIALQQFGDEGGGDARQVLSRVRDEAVRRSGVRSPDLLSRLDHVMVIAQEWVDRLATLHGNFEEFLAKTRTMVCGTCVGLGRSQFGVVNNRYDWVIVDEAARATPGELAVAIQSGRRVLLVGDHRQLPPLYSKEVIDHIGTKLTVTDRDVLTRSDFERGFESPYGAIVGATLKTQYRMAPPIGELVSECFYPSPLLPGRGAPAEFYNLLPKAARKVVSWIDTSQLGRGAYDRKQASHSFDNALEVRTIIALLRQISEAEDFISELNGQLEPDERPIGVICTYADQKRLLQKSLSTQEWAVTFRDLVKIDTVDSYQGKENRMIILSLTRNNDEHDQGFLRSPERTNVSISRAMDRLVIVGAMRMWTEANGGSPLAKVANFIKDRIETDHFQILDASALLVGRR